MYPVAEYYRLLWARARTSRVSGLVSVVVCVVISNVSDMETVLFVENKTQESGNS
jgi:hypothetical protein